MRSVSGRMSSRETFFEPSTPTLTKFPDEPRILRFGRLRTMAIFSLVLAPSLDSSLTAGLVDEVVDGARETRRGLNSSDDLRLFTEMLDDVTVPAGFRREAATRLGRAGTAEAALVLGRVLKGNDVMGREAVLEGLRAVPSLPRPVVREVLAAVIEGIVSPEEGAAVLAGADVDGIITVVSRFQETEERVLRLRLIDLLGRLGDPAAPGALVEALRFAIDDEEADAIDESLQRWSNSEVSRDANAWRSWWNNLNMDGDGSRALRQLANRIAQESARADAQAQRAEGLANRIAELYANLLALLPEVDRMPRLRIMLDDEESMVRLVAVAQIERMLRDAKLPPDEIREAIVARLGDIDPRIRIKATKILDALGGEDLGPILVRSLVIESDPEVIRTGLQVLGGRPQPDAVAFAIERLGDEDAETAALAARVIATVAAVGQLHPDDRDRVRSRFTDLAMIDSRDEARLVVLVSDRPDETVDLLVVEDEMVRRGAAEAYRTLGRRDILFEGALNPTVMRVAIQAWSEVDSKIGPVNIQTMLSLRPDEDAPDAETDLATWRAAMIRLLEAMPTAKLPETESMLALETTLIDERCKMLRRGTADRTLGEADRVVLHRLLARILAGSGRPLEAVLEYRAAGAGEEGSVLRQELLAALFLAEEWDDASDLAPVPAVWIDFLEDRPLAEAEFSRGMLVEIDRRFESDIQATDQTRLDALQSRLGGIATETAEKG